MLNVGLAGEAIAFGDDLRGGGTSGFSFFTEAELKRLMVPPRFGILGGTFFLGCSCFMVVVPAEDDFAGENMLKGDFFASFSGCDAGLGASFFAGGENKEKEGLGVAGLEVCAGFFRATGFSTFFTPKKELKASVTGSATSTSLLWTGAGLGFDFGEFLEALKNEPKSIAGDAGSFFFTGALVGAGATFGLDTSFFGVPWKREPKSIWGFELGFLDMVGAGFGFAAAVTFPWGDLLGNTAERLSPTGFFFLTGVTLD